MVDVDALYASISAFATLGGIGDIGEGNAATREAKIAKRSVKECSAAAKELRMLSECVGEGHACHGQQATRLCNASLRADSDSTLAVEEVLCCPRETKGGSRHQDNQRQLLRGAAPKVRSSMRNAYPRSILIYRSCE